MTFSRGSLSDAWSMPKTIFAFVDGEARPISATILKSTLAPNSDGKYQVPAGMFIAKYGAAFQFLKRAKVTVASATSSPNLTVTPAIAQVFAANDVLYPVHPYGTVTIASTWAANDTATVTINGIAVTYTATGSTLASIASGIAAAINAHASLSQIVTAIASGAVVSILGKDGRTLYTLAASESTAGDGTATASASALVGPTTALGTISTVNATTGAIVLSGNAGLALPVGTPVRVREDDVLAICPHEFEFSTRDRYVFPGVTESRGVYEQSLPYIDDELKYRFKGAIRFGTKF